MGVAWISLGRGNRTDCGWTGGRQVGIQTEGIKRWGGGWRKRVLGEMPGTAGTWGPMQKPNAVETPWNL